jgi:glycine cleavage system transcriptional repressor
MTKSASSTGSRHALSKLEGLMTSFGEQLGLTIIHERTRKREWTEPAIPCAIEVVAMDHPGTPLSSVVMTVGIHTKVHIPTLRGDFLDYCDDLNLDATFEPVWG